MRTKTFWLFEVIMGYSLKHCMDNTGMQDKRQINDTVIIVHLSCVNVILTCVFFMYVGTLFTNISGQSPLHNMCHQTQKKVQKLIYDFTLALQKVQHMIITQVILFILVRPLYLVLFMSSVKTILILYAHYHVFKHQR